MRFAEKAPDILSKRLTRTLLLDLETTREGKIHHLGAVYKDRVLEADMRTQPKQVLSRLDEMAHAADFILGHNLLGHDFPILRTTAAHLKLLNKPVIDTLYLSPLAFPQNPYHHLIKDYKLVRSTINDPVADARLAASVFEDQWHSLAAIAHKTPEMIAFFQFCFHLGKINGFSGNGLASVFADLGNGLSLSPDEALQIFKSLSTDSVCPNATDNALGPLLPDPLQKPSLAYCLAWLRIAGSNSVLPPWVRHRFPDIRRLIHTLRISNCGNPGCSFCLTNHHPEKQLKRFFGFENFRPKPQTQDGKSLQREVVIRGMNDQPLIAILPTGGGKSICYQIPALLRHWRSGALTIVISPLQALMKDQVDNLVKNTGTPFAEAIYGLQTPPERGAVMERVRLGDVAILYLSPEQLRSRSVRHVLRQREIGCWVFDEAHCLSKWGHDFRPDYLYTARFIREFSEKQHLPVPPVCGYTATAKKDVIEDIRVHFRDQLGQDLTPLVGGVQRDNLTFEVIPVGGAEKYELGLDLINKQLETDATGSVIVYAARRKETEAIRDFLRQQGLAAEAFHGGLDAQKKRDIIESFVNGDFPIICATNAFGMGIDKGNIRLVLHFEMPGSLENYIQEAGRAGRDRSPARCVLLYSPEDADAQFGLGALSQIKKREIEQILRVLRQAKKNKSGEIIITSDELIRDDALAELYENKQEIRDTKVKTALSWLERSGFLKRNHNQTDVFQGKPLVHHLEEAYAIIDRQHLNPWNVKLWRNIIQLFFNNDQERGLSADSIAEQVFRDKHELQQLQAKAEWTPSQLVIRALHDMSEAGLLDRGIMLSAILRPKGKNNASSILKRIIALELQVLRLMREEAPDADNGEWVSMDLRRFNQRLINEGYDTTPHVIVNLLKGIAMDGKGLAASTGSIELFHQGLNRYGVKLLRNWEAIQKIVTKRHNIAHVILETLIASAEKLLAADALNNSLEVNLPFSTSDLAGAIRADIALNAEVKDVLAAIDRGLIFLHEHKAITLQGGMAVLRQAMTIQLEKGAKRRRYGIGDFKPLAVHYREKRFQIHVMAEYAQLGMEKISNALYLVFDYFELGRTKFINKYFADRLELLEKAVTQDAYRNVVEKLGNPVQIAVVGGPADQNMLILAGPGSGKTTVIVHRCAYLLLVERIPARQILVLCFNHNASISLRKRITGLIGKAARGVRIATYHGLAMQLTGLSVREMIESGRRSEVDFKKVIRDAVRLLKGETELVGIEPELIRDQLVGGYSHILVDEYQDIDQDQYDLISAIAGRSLKTGEGRLSIMAVGDDDQNIYSFRGANVKYIRQFRKDYEAEVTYLVENYRSSQHIIQVSNQLIAYNHDRMKGTSPIQINRERASALPGGRWQQLDTVTQGRVHLIEVPTVFHQAVAVDDALQRIEQCDPETQWDSCAVLARTKQLLNGVRSLLESSGRPLKTVLDKSLPFQRVREVARFIDELANRGNEPVRASELADSLKNLSGGKCNNIWWQMLDDFLTSYGDETADASLPVNWAVDGLYEYLTEQKRDKTLGRGLFLSTIHAAKGMEFDHVFILDGDWRTAADTRHQEDERRILYVGMTRARETLTLLKTKNQSNPLLKVLRGDSIREHRASPVTLEKGIQESLMQHYELLGLNDLYLDFAGRFQPDHEIHRHLAALNTGDKVLLVPHQQHTEIRNQAGFTVARLSAEASARLAKISGRIRDVRVVAMLKRLHQDPEERFRRWLHAAWWELPLVEIIYN